MFFDARPNPDAGLPYLVYILENRFLAAEYLRSILSQNARLQLVLKDLSFINVKQHADRNQCVLLVDYLALGKSPKRTLHMLKAAFPCSECVLMGDGPSIQKARPLIGHECFDVVSYIDLPYKLVTVIESAANCPRLASTSSSIFTDADHFSECHGAPHMTKREREIIELVQHRLSNKEIANRLNIAEVTVKFHLSNIFDKVKVARRRELFSMPI